MLPYILKICFILYNLLFILPFPGPEKVERYAATGLLHIDQMVRHNLYSCSISFYLLLQIHRVMILKHNGSKAQNDLFLAESVSGDQPRWTPLGLASA